MEQQVQVYTVISDNSDSFKHLAVHYNGQKVSDDEKVSVIRRHYQIMALKKYGISLKDNDGKALKNDLVINGLTCKPKIPALLFNDAGVCVENLEQYYERTKRKAAISYGNLFRGLERIDFVPKMI